MRAWIIEMERAGVVEYYDPEMRAWRERSRLEKERFSIVAEDPFAAEDIAKARLDGRILKICRGGDLACENPLSRAEMLAFAKEARRAREAAGALALQAAASQEAFFATIH